MRKHAADFPDSLTSASFPANSGELRGLPSGVRTQNQAPLGILVRISAASLRSAAAISAGDGSSGSRASGSSRSWNRQRPLSRLLYSSAAAW